MPDQIITEDGLYLVSENVAGLASASTLNDVRVTLITKETFTISPATNGWLFGSGWSWSGSNMTPV